MKSILVIFISLTSFINAQPQILPSIFQFCGANQEFRTCFLRCEPSCNNPIPTTCNIPCVLRCQCYRGYYRDSNNNCVLPNQCAAAPAAPIFVIAGPVPPPRPSKPDDCGTNEVFTSCFNTCYEAKCPSGAPPVNCPAYCYRGCSCRSGYLRNTMGDCVLPYYCPQYEPPPPTPAPLPRCGANEVYSSCYNPCSEWKCPVRSAPRIICPFGCTPGCTCRNGYYRLINGVCVTNYDCPRLLPDPNCNLYCRVGYICRFRSNRPRCVRTPFAIDNRQPTSPHPTCKSTKCSKNQQCALVRPQNCQGFNCEKPTCIEKNACKTTSCERGKHCVLRQVVCVRAPCDPVAECARSRTDGWI